MSISDPPVLRATRGLNSAKQGLYNRRWRVQNRAMRTAQMRRYRERLKARVESHEVSGRGSK